jgi:cyclophilin family peptidyl-prolyl cis-trans isomerase
MDLALYAADAPLTVYNIASLARRGYFDEQHFHRVVPNFVAQAGDPRGDGSGGPGYAIRDELNRHRYERGTLGMALSGPDTGGSQFFITHSAQPHLDGGYTVFGELVGGFEVLDRIIQGDRIVRVTVH